MSRSSIYTTYSYQESIIKFFIDFLKEKGEGLVPAWLIGKLEKLESYEISDAAKQTEFAVILERYFGSLNNDERLRMENEMANRMTDYLKENKRKLEKTGIENGRVRLTRV